MLINRVMLPERWKRPENNVPGKVVQSMSPEQREALSSLTSDQLSNIRVEEYWTTSPDYEAKLEALELEKKMGIQPPPRKKYE